MALKQDDGKFKCLFCEEEYEHEQKADECMVNHNLIYVPMTREELNQFIMYIYELRDPPVQLIYRLKKIQKRESKK